MLQDEKKKSKKTTYWMGKSILQTIYLLISKINKELIKLKSKTSSQDGDIGRHTVLPGTTKRRTIKNLKTKNNQNCQKIELYGSPTTKELKTHSSRLVGKGGEGKLERRGPTARWQLVDWVRQRQADQAVPHFYVHQPGGTTGERERLRNPGL